MSSYTDKPDMEQLDIYQSDTSESYTVEPNQQEKVYSDMSVTALVLGLVGLVPFIGLVTAILAIIFGARTLQGIKLDQVPLSSKGQAMAGLILGIIITSLYVMFFTSNISGLGSFTILSGTSEETLIN